MELIINTHNCFETMSLGERLGQSLPNGSIVKLNGELGVGKTTLVRGIAKGLSIKDVIQSPTFNIMKVYFKGDRPLIHIDAYRLENANSEIGLDEYIGYEKGITVIEWPLFINDLIPSDVIDIDIINDGGDKRIFKIKGGDLFLGAVNK